MNYLGIHILKITINTKEGTFEEWITDNLINMHYECIDKQKGFKKLNKMSCKDALPIINNAIEDMYENKDKYRKLSSRNDWGDYNELLATLWEIQDCCEDNPDEIINVR